MVRFLITHVYVPEKLGVHGVQVEVAVETRPLNSIGCLKMEDEMSTGKSDISSGIVADLMRSFDSSLCNCIMGEGPNTLRDMIIVNDRSHDSEN